MKKAFLYVRVSTAEQVKEGYSIGEQTERLKAYCKAQNWKVIKVYTDGGYSGGNTDRPALQEMMLNLNKTDCILVYKLDRLSRSQKDTLILIDKFLSAGVDFASITENFDTGTPFGRAMIGILSVFAQLEREQIKERMILGKEGRAKEGRWHGGGYLPIGYDYVGGKLVINEYEAMQIRELHKLFQEGKNYMQIEQIFADKGYSQKHGLWRPKTIKTVLMNPLYIGKINYNGEILDGEHEAIITEDTYAKSMEIINSRPSKVRPGRKSLLGGLIFCAYCGARYRYYVTGKMFHYYGCYSRSKTKKALIRDPNCKNKIWKQEELDELVLNEIKKLKTENRFEELIQIDDNSSIIKKEIEKIKNQKSRFMDLYGVGTFSVEELQDKIKPLNDRIEKLTEQLSAPALSEIKAKELVDSFEDVLKKGEFLEIKNLIDSLISKIEIDNEDVTIYWNF